MTFTILDSIYHRVEMLLTKNGNSNPGDLKRLKITTTIESPYYFDLRVFDTPIFYLMDR